MGMEVAEATQAKLERHDKLELSEHAQWSLVIILGYDFVGL